MGVTHARCCGWHVVTNWNRSRVKSRRWDQQKRNLHQRARTDHCPSATRLGHCDRWRIGELASMDFHRPTNLEMEITPCSPGTSTAPLTWSNSGHQTEFCFLLSWDAKHTTRVREWHFEFTDVTLVSEDTCWRLYWCDSGDTSGITWGPNSQLLL